MRRPGLDVSNVLASNKRPLPAFEATTSCTYLPRYRNFQPQLPHGVAQASCLILLHPRCQVHWVTYTSARPTEKGGVPDRQLGIGCPNSQAVTIHLVLTYLEAHAGLRCQQGSEKVWAREPRRNARFYLRFFTKLGIQGYAVKALELLSAATELTDGHSYFVGLQSTKTQLLDKSEGGLACTVLVIAYFFLFGRYMSGS